MQICRDLAGFSYGQADNVRRAMSKKKLKVMEAEREHFIYGCTEPGKECPGCVRNGVPANVANELYDHLIHFASYAFNKAHAACYAYVAYQTAWLKCHYPAEFMAALLTSEQDSRAKIIEYSAECQRLGLRLLPPDINVSSSGFTADGSSIRYGLAAIKDVGEGLIKAVVAERARRPFRGLYDFCKRLHGTELNRRAVEKLVRAGAFDALEPTRRGMLESIEPLMRSIENDARQNLEGQLDLFSALAPAGGAAQEDYPIPALPEFSISELLKMEKEVSGLYLSGHPLDEYHDLIGRVSSCTIGQLLGDEAKAFDNQMVTIVCTVVKSRVMTTKSNTLMAFTTIEDLTGTMEMLVFPRVYSAVRPHLQDNAVIVARGRASIKEEDGTRLLLEDAQPAEGYDPEKGFEQNHRVEMQRRTRPAQAGSAGLFLTLPSQNSPEMERVKNLLENIFDGGTTRVYFKFNDTGRKVLARKMAVRYDPLLHAELVRLLGDANVTARQAKQTPAAQ